MERSVCVTHNNYVNNYGHRLVQLCRNMDIHFAKRRVGKDRYISSLTCRYTSTVDYMIVSSQVLPGIYDFLLMILMHCFLIAIEHCVLSFLLQQNNLMQVIFLVLSRMVST